MKLEVYYYQALASEDFIILLKVLVDSCCNQQHEEPRKRKTECQTRAAHKPTPTMNTYHSWFLRVKRILLPTHLKSARCFTRGCVLFISVCLLMKYLGAGGDNRSYPAFGIYREAKSTKCLTMPSL